MVIRRLVGGCVEPPRNAKGSEVRHGAVVYAVAQAHEAGITLQRAAWEMSRELRYRIAERTKELDRVRAFARRWRMEVIRGGPKRASMLLEAAAARYEMRVRMAQALQTGRLGSAQTEQLMLAGSSRIRRHVLTARGPGSSVSHRAALREWRWIALFRRWLLRTSRKARGYALEPIPGIVSEVINWVDTWQLTSCVRTDRRILPPIDIWVGFRGGGCTAHGGLAERALAPRVKLWW